jgi:hypothetical protein
MQQCPTNTEYDGKNCVVLSNISADTSIFKFNSYFFLSINKNESCPYNSRDDGTYADGRHCQTKLKVDGDISVFKYYNTTTRLWSLSTDSKI